MIDARFDPQQIRASAILARLPIPFAATECLVIDDTPSPMLYSTLRQLTNEIPMIVISPKATGQRPHEGIGDPSKEQKAKGQRFIIVPTLKEGLQSGKDQHFGLIIFISKKIKPVLGIIEKILKDRLKPDGIAILVSTDSSADIPIPPGTKRVETGEFVKKMFPIEETVIVIRC